ncbi:unnamed protein product [Ectocarpus sp. 13 AM-2016]
MVLHAFLQFIGLTRSRPPTPTCELPGCSRPCFIEPNGHVHDYCGVTHARQAKAPSSPAPAATPFDGTREYVSPGVLLFWQPPSVFSQWTPSVFVVDNVQYRCAEQYMMAEKAKLFGDEGSWQKIMATHSPREHKDLGRGVSGYDQDVWDQHKFHIVAQGNYAKFTQNEMMGQRLLDTGEKLLAEASPYDRVWGIGLRADNPAARTPSSWRGQNLLGNILQEVRTQMIAEAVGDKPPSPLPP